MTGTIPEYRYQAAESSTILVQAFCWRPLCEYISIAQAALSAFGRQFCRLRIALRPLNKTRAPERVLLLRVSF